MIKAKAIWVVAKDHATGRTLTVTGRQLDGSSTARFAGGDGYAEPGSVGVITGQWEGAPEALAIQNAEKGKMTPGGVSTGAIDSYALHGSIIMYPVAGCWELTARLGDAEVRIVQLILEERPG